MTVNIRIDDQAIAADDGDTIRVDSPADKMDI